MKFSSFVIAAIMFICISVVGVSALAQYPSDFITVYHIAHADEPKKAEIDEQIIGEPKLKVDKGFHVNRFDALVSVREIPPIDYDELECRTVRIYRGFGQEPDRGVSFRRECVPRVDDTGELLNPWLYRIDAIIDHNLGIVR
ncbi:MAG: hypothetical protein ACMXYE_01125 [Candidatus Woesearchaeota archaeon]